MEISGTTVLTGLLGSPVGHSISPKLHNTAFKKLGLDYVYLAFDVDTSSLQVAMSGLKSIGARGFNLTMPNKNLGCEFVDNLSPVAKMVGAINTVVNDNGILSGHITDGIGYMQAVARAGHNIIGKKITILGAGGAASAICAQAALDGVREIDIFSRKKNFVSRTEHLVDKINSQTSCIANFYDLRDELSLKNSINSSSLLINATPVGMAPNTADSIVTDRSLFHEGLVVSDLIYSPEKTTLLSLAEQCNCYIFNGYYMLVYQAAAAFKLWTGFDMPIDV